MYVQLPPSEIPSAHQTFTLFDLIRELQLYLASWDLEMII
jgi:hypothetical protein